MRDRRWIAIGARSLSILAWLVVVVVMIRVLSGGGTLTGVGYVLGTESPVTLAFVGATLVVAPAVMITLARGQALAWATAWKGGIIALVGALALLVADHESAVLAVVAAGLALAIAVAMVRRSGGTA